MNKKIVALISLTTSLLPAGVLAAPFDPGARPAENVGANTATITGLIGVILGVIWLVFIAFAVLMFIIAGFQFLSAQGEPEGVKKSQKSMLWGAVGVAAGIIAFTLPFIIRGRLGL